MKFLIVELEWRFLNFAAKTKKKLMKMFPNFITIDWNIDDRQYKYWKASKTHIQTHKIYEIFARSFSIYDKHHNYIDQILFKRSKKKTMCNQMILKCSTQTIYSCFYEASLVPIYVLSVAFWYTLAFLANDNFVFRITHLSK